MKRVKLSNGIESERFIFLFKLYIDSHIKKNLNLPIIVWDYDVKNICFEELGYNTHNLQMDFITMKSIKDEKLDVDADIVIIENFVSIPTTVQRCLIESISNKKYKPQFIFQDKKSSSRKLEDDVFDKMIHFVVKSIE